MKSEVTLDRAGRLVLPKALRDELHLSPGDTLDLSSDGEEVTLRPRRPANSLERERGVWVFRSGDPLTQADANEALRSIRAQRSSAQAGNSQ